MGCTGWVHLHAFDAQFQGALDVAEFDDFDSGSQRGSAAGQSSAPGTADAMDEVFSDFGDVIVDDVGDVITVQSAGGDVGGDQYLEAAFLESAEGAVALRLRAVAVNHGGGEAVAGKVLGEALGAALGAGEDERLTFFVVEKLAENVDLFAGTNFVGFEFHAFGGLQDRTQRDAHGIAHVFMDESGDGLLERGREAQCLTVFRQHGKNAADGRKESHVEHAVGFVEDEHLDVAQVGEAAIGEILQASGSRDDERGSGTESLNLSFLGDAADHERGLGHVLAAQLFVLFVDLHRKFTSRQQDQSVRLTRGLFAEHFDDGDQEGEGFAGSGLGGADDVFAIESGLDGALLNGS